MAAVPRVRPRIGTTSFVFPASWIENVRRLARRVEDIEILVFERPERAGPSPAEIEEIAALGRAQGLTFSVHAPLDLALASPDPAQRADSIEAVLRTARLTAPLSPHTLVVHLEPAAGGLGGPSLSRPPQHDDWRRRAASSLEALLAGGLSPGAICLENPDGGFGAAEPLLDELGLSAALDLGHLARDGVPFDAMLARHLSRARLIHLHGTEPGGRDHRSLRHYPRAEALRLLRALAGAGWAGVLTLEVFRQDDLEDSLQVLAGWWREAVGEDA